MSIYLINNLYQQLISLISKGCLLGFYLLLVISSFICHPNQVQAAENLKNEESEKSEKSPKIASNQDLVANSSQEYLFSPSLAHSTFLSADVINSFNRKQQVLAGIYDIDLYLNDSYIKRLKQVRLTANNNVCLDDDLLLEIGVKQENIKQLNPPNNCTAIADRISGAVARFDASKMALYLTIADNQLIKKINDVVNPDDLQVGESIAFINYFANYYHAQQTGIKQRYDSGFLSLNGGINFGLWQLRSSSYINTASQQKTQITRGNTYLQRPILSIQGNLQLGELSANSNLLSAVEFIGLNLSSDTRMLPNIKQGYAPEVHGIAKTNAKVAVIQNGQQIYQTTVAPGAFVIDDLYATSYQGDLEVIITEADGEINRFEVPYSSVSESMRPHMSLYNFNIGKTDINNLQKQAYFSDFTYQYGLNNAITLNGGLRISDDYQSLLLGSVYSNFLGAFGANVTYSNAKLNQIGTQQGYLGHLSYSKTFKKTDTNISLVNYRYSSKSYYDLNDLLHFNQQAKQKDNILNDPYVMQSRFDASVSQSLNKFGYISLNSSVTKYRNQQDDNKQLQLSYGTSFKGISFSLSHSKQYNANRQTDNITSISLSIPLDGIRSNIRANYTRSANAPAQYSASYYGITDNNTSYSIGANHTEQASSSYNASVSRSFSKAHVSGNFSNSPNYWQAGAGINGAMAIHGGGITLGNYLGDTFALVEAKNAAGAEIMNQHNIKIDNLGYALVPSLNPYRYSDIGINPKGMNLNTEILTNSQKVAPYAGATLKLKFTTKTGYPVLIKGTYDIAAPLPFGAEVLNEQDEVIGLVGQGGQIYLRLDSLTGKLKVRLSDNKTCRMIYDISNSSNNHPFTKTIANCL